MTKYRIDLLDRAPAMTKSVAALVEGSYQDAVERAHEIFQSARAEESSTVGHKVYSRSVSVHSGSEVYSWHHISMSGEVTDRNKSSGVVFPTY